MTANETAPASKDEIKKALTEKYGQFIDWVKNTDEEELRSGPEGKWSGAQHIDHILRSTRPLNMALRLPKFIPRIWFGKSNREGRSYDGLIARYNEKLSAGGAASGRYVPPEKGFSKSRFIDQLEREQDRLIRALDSWSDEQMDNYVLPHPLLGKLTVREMYFFTIYHTQHHIDILARDY